MMFSLQVTYPGGGGGNNSPMYPASPRNERRAGGQVVQGVRVTNKVIIFKSRFAPQTHSQWRRTSHVPLAFTPLSVRFVGSPILPSGTPTLEGKLKIAFGILADIFDIFPSALNGKRVSLL